MEELIKAYDSYKKKLKLPDFNELDVEFEISSIEEEGFVLRKIRRKIVDKVIEFSDVLNRIVDRKSVV